MIIRGSRTGVEQFRSDCRVSEQLLYEIEAHLSERDWRFLIGRRDGIGIYFFRKGLVEQSIEGEERYVVWEGFQTCYVEENQPLEKLKG